MKRAQLIIKNVYLIISILFNLILVIGFGSVSFDGTADYPVSFAITLILTPFSFLVISIIALTKRISFGKSIFFKVTFFFFFLGLSFIGMDDGIYALIFFESIASLFFVIMAVLFTQKRTRSPGKDWTPQMQKREPFCYKGKWAWDDALAEYLQKTGRNSIEELTEEDYNKIYRYTMMPIVYFFYWIFDQGFMSEDFYALIGDENVDECLKRNITPLDLLEQMDYCVHEDDFMEGITEFIHHYFESRYFSLYNDYFVFDYYAEIKNEEGFYYCVDFSWETCDRLYSKIEKAYEKRQSYGSEDYYEWDEKIENLKDIYSTRFDTKLEIYKDGQKIKNNITQEYIEKCIADLDSIDEKQFERLDRWISERYDSDDCPIKGKVMSQFDAQSIHVFEPENESEVAYVISGGAEFEDEHGIGLYIRNGIIFDYGYSYDFEEIYSPESIRKFERAANDIDFIQLNEKSQIETLEKEGKLVRTYLIPPELGGTEEEENLIYITPLALKEKELLDNRVQALIASWCGKLKYVYKADYYDETNRLVPQQIYVYHDTDSLTSSVFHYYINVWE